MKYFFLFALLSIATLASFAQSPTFEEDAKKLDGIIKEKSLKFGFSLLINYESTNNASFFITPKKKYLIYFVYDIEPRVPVNFKAYLMNPDKKVEQKYTAIPEDIVVQGSAKVAALRFSTPAFKAEKKPIKIEANPKAKIYIFYK